MPSLSIYLKNCRKILHQINNDAGQKMILYLTEEGEIRKALLSNGQVSEILLKRDIQDAALFSTGGHSILVTHNNKKQFHLYRQSIEYGTELPRLSSDVRSLQLLGSSCERLLLIINESQGERVYQITPDLVTLVDHLLL